MRPIDANALKREILNQLNRFDTSENEFNNCYPYWIFSKTLKEAPTLDYEPVKRGEWLEWWPGDCALILTGEEMLWQCSECTAKFSDVENMRFCPNCGAKMDGGKKHD